MLKKLNKLLVGIMSFTILFGVLSSNIFANEFSKNEIKSKFIEMGVSEVNAENLSIKVKEGKLLDSMKKEYENMEPTIVEENADFRYEIYIYIYPDGSVKELRVSRPSTILDGMLSGGKWYAGTGYFVWSGVKVFASWGVVTATFYADIEGTSTTGKINRVYDYGVTVMGGTYSDAILSIARNTATDSNPAEAKLFFSATAVGNFGQSTFYLRLYVPKGEGAYAKFSMPN